MRIDHLRLIAFGPFTDREIALDGPGVQVIYGPNGAGKSTSMRALEGLLFGIPARTDDAWRHAMPDLRVGARLVAADGTALDVVRRKKNRPTLYGTDGEPLPDSALTAFLGGIDIQLYRTMFSLSQQALREGGDALLADKGDLGAALFGAGTGNAGARGLLRRLEDEAAELFKPSGSKPRINDALRRHRDATKAVGQAGVTASAWGALDAQVRDAQASRDRTTETAADVRRRLARAERLLRAFVPVKERAGLLADPAELGDVPLLAVDAEQQRLDAQRVRATARGARDRATTAREAAVAELDGLHPDPAVLEQEDRIDALREEVGRHRKNEQDLVRLQTETAIAANEAIDAMGAVGPHASLEDDGASLAIPAAAAQGIRSLAAEHAELQAAVTSADRSMEEEARTRDALRDELQALPEAEDTGTLDHAARTARTAGDLDALVRRDAATLERSITALRADTARLPHVGDDLDAVVALPVPLGATVDGFVEERSALDARAEALERDAAKTESELRTVEDDLRRLELAGDVPTEDDLHRARDARDERWTGIRTAWLTDVPAGTDDAALAEQFGGDVMEADRTADRLRAESQRVAQKAQLVVRRERLTDDAERHEADRRTLARDRAAHEARWIALWEPCGIVPGAPKAMATWAATHRELVRAVDALAEKRSELSRDEALRDEHRGVLARALGEDAATDRTLAARLDEAEARCEDADELRRARATLESRIREQERKFATCAAAETKARDELATWREAWAASVGVLDLDPESPPAQALAALDAIEVFRARREKLLALERRVSGLERDIAQFATDVEALRSSLEEPEGTDPAATIAALVQRLKRARAAADASAIAVEKRDASTREIIEAEAAERDAERELAALRAAAGVATDDDLPAAEERSARVRDLRGELADCEKRIVELGEDELETLVEAVEDADRDALTAEAEALTEEEETLAEERSRIDQELGTARGELRRVDGSDEAAAQAEVAQQALAEVAEHTERYVRVRLAAQLLRRAIETYREKTAGPVLRRANELFPELTNGAFTGVASDLGDHDEPVLLALRHQDRIHVEHLSDGERDALYSALRVATLEHYFQTSDPMPLILDDLMLNLDDDRSKAAFRVLGRLTEVTQVLLFTHHRHLVELAEEALGGGGVRVLELAG
jgi:uncharacterized protein YhaN